MRAEDEIVDDPKRLNIDYSTFTHRGMTFAIAWYDKSFVPGGFLWGHWHYKVSGGGDAVRARFDLLGCYTLPTWRRRGVMTGLIKQLFNVTTCDCIRTDDGSGDGGMKLLESMGFEFCDDTKLWYLKRAIEVFPET